MKKESVGKVLRIARISNDLSITETSKLSQISKSFICEIEKGEKWVNIKKFQVLARVFNMTSNQLINLIKYYDNLEDNIEDIKKYQLTLMKALEKIVNNS